MCGDIIFKNEQQLRTVTEQLDIFTESEVVIGKVTYSGTKDLCEAVAKLTEQLSIAMDALSEVKNCRDWEDNGAEHDIANQALAKIEEVGK